MSEPHTLAIVYQFGKVASTSIVNALNRSPGVEAHQSHFLGEDALRKSITNATDGKLNSYFRKHLVGQIVANLDLTYRVNRIQNNLDNQMLKIVSLTREPIDWLRSCVQQDIEGYRDEILAYSALHLDENRQPTVEHGLTLLLEDLATCISSFGGIQATISAFRNPCKQIFFERANLPPHEIARRLLLLTFRPLLWFKDHFETCFQVNLADFEKSNGFWSAVDQKATFLILRYEDIDTALPNAFSAAGLDGALQLARANSSKNKPYAKEIGAAFSSSAAQNLRQIVLESDYADFFGYSGDHASAAA